jgi:ATP-dependent RNA helicase DDX21
VLAPTRELAKQVSDEFSKYGPEYSVLSVYGGAPYGPQEGSLRRGTDIVVGTPGRLLDHLEKQTLKLENIRTLIMDEADHMLDMGFAPDMERILSKIKEEKQEAGMHSHQTLLFSATMPVWVRKVSRAFLKPDQVMIDLVGEDVHKVADNVVHYAIACEDTTSKASIIRDCVNRWAPQGKAICFVERKVEADEIERSLGSSLKVAALHGDVSQQRRDQIITTFKAGKLDLLIATDVASR